MKRLLLQLLAAVLPWPLTYALLCWIADRHKDAPVARAAFARARALGAADDEGAFCRRHILYRLVDQADLALAYFRGMRWQRRWVREEGVRLPEAGPYLLLSFHFGAGMHALRAFGERMPHVAVINTDLGNGGRIDRLLGRLRLRACARLLRAPFIPMNTGVAIRMLRHLEHGAALAALVDVPSPKRRGASRTLPFFSGEIGLPTGMARLAVRAGVPVYVYACMLVQDSPARLLRVDGPLPTGDEATLSAELGRLFEDMVRRDPAAWHLWPIADTVFAPSRES
jgi:lauroyl/myristoyl acyltransferase